MERSLSEVLSEFARTLVTDFPIRAILDHLVGRIVDVLPISGAGVTLMAPNAQPQYVAASDAMALRYEKIQSDLGEGPCVAAYKTGRAVAVPDLRLDVRFPRFAVQAVNAGLLAIFTFPLRDADRQLGALDLYRTTPGPLDHDDMAAAQTLADVASAYLLNAQARVDLEESAERARQSAINDAEAVAALRMSEARKTAILASALDAVVTVDERGTIVEFNPAAERTFGYEKDDAVGRQLDALVTPPEPLGHRWVGLDGYLAEDHSNLVGRRTRLLATRADGTTFPSEVSISAVRGLGPPLFTGFVRDLTEEEEAEARRRRLEDRLHQTERMESLGQLAGGIAHDFNNLLTVILNYASFIAEGTDDAATARDHAARIVSSAKRAAQLTQQLLMFARREPVRRKHVDVNAVVVDVHELLARAIGEEIHLVLRLTGELPLVLADRGQIEQVLMNLAVNARHAMPEGGTLTITTEIITLGPDRHVQVEVSDTGLGMSDEVMARAFDPFFTTRAVGEGSGLGLPTVYGIVADADGTVSLRSIEGSGTTVTVTLPVTESPAIDEPLVSDAAESDGTGQTVLVVEDQEAVRQVTIEMLQRHGYRVLEAASARSAKALAVSTPFDLLLTDIVMPDRSGRELAADLRSLGVNHRVLFMSGYNAAAPDALGALDGTELLLRKPFTEAELLRAVTEVLEQ